MLLTFSFNDNLGPRSTRMLCRGSGHSQLFSVFQKRKAKKNTKGKRKRKLVIWNLKTKGISYMSCPKRGTRTKFQLHVKYRKVNWIKTGSSLTIAGTMKIIIGTLMIVRKTNKSNTDDAIRYHCAYVEFCCFVLNKKGVIWWGLTNISGIWDCRF